MKTKHRNDVYYFIKVIMNITKQPSQCWTWNKSINKDGYGQTCYKGKQIGVHNLMMKLLGHDSTGLHIDHICKNRACCNPEHLRFVTPRENILYNSNNVAAKNLHKKICKYGHPLSGNNLKVVKEKNGTRRYCLQCRRDIAAKKRGGKKQHTFIDPSYLREFL